MDEAVNFGVLGGRSASGGATPSAADGDDATVTDTERQAVVAAAANLTTRKGTEYAVPPDGGRQSQAPAGSGGRQQAGISHHFPPAAPSMAGPSNPPSTLRRAKSKKTPAGQKSGTTTPGSFNKSPVRPFSTAQRSGGSGKTKQMDPQRPSSSKDPRSKPPVLGGTTGSADLTRRGPFRAPLNTLADDEMAGSPAEFDHSVYDEPKTLFSDGDDENDTPSSRQPGATNPANVPFSASGADVPIFLRMALEGVPSDMCRNTACGDTKNVMKKAYVELEKISKSTQVSLTNEQKRLTKAEQEIDDLTLGAQRDAIHIADNLKTITELKRQLHAARNSDGSKGRDGQGGIARKAAPRKATDGMDPLNDDLVSKHSGRPSEFTNALLIVSTNLFSNLHASPLYVLQHQFRNNQATLTHLDTIYSHPPPRHSNRLLGT